MDPSFKQSLLANAAQSDQYDSAAVDSSSSFNPTNVPVSATASSAAAAAVPFDVTRVPVPKAWQGVAANLQQAKSEVEDPVIPLPKLTERERDIVFQQARHHHAQTQQLLLVLLGSSILTLALLYILMRILSLVDEADNLFRGIDVPLMTRAKYFGLPSLASMLLSGLMYAGFRAVWKKKTWRVMKEEQNLCHNTVEVIRNMFSREEAASATGAQSPSSSSPQAAAGNEYPGAKDSGAVQGTYASKDGFSHSVSIDANRMNSPLYAPSGDYNHATAMPPQPHALRKPSASDEHEMSRSALQKLQLSYHAGGDLSSALESKDEFENSHSPRKESIVLELEKSGSVAMGEVAHRDMSSPSAPLASQQASALPLYSPAEAPVPPAGNAPLRPEDDANVVAKQLAQVFTPPPMDTPYFFSASSLLHPSDMIFIQQHPSWSQRLWAFLFQFYYFQFIPMFSFAIAMAIFSNSGSLSSWELSLFMTAANQVSSLMVKLLVTTPMSCFGNRTMQSAWGFGFSLNFYVSILSILNPLMVFTARSFAETLPNNMVEPSSEQRRHDLKALFDSVLIGYIMNVATDESVLTLQAVFRYKNMSRYQQEIVAEAQAKAHPQYDADGRKVIPPPKTASVKLRAAMMGYSLDGELKLYLFTVIYPLVLATVNPDILLAAVCIIPFIYLGMKIRYEMFSHMLNEEEENIQLEYAPIRRGSDLMKFAAINSVLYTATQWIILGSTIVFMVLNLNSAFDLIPTATTPLSSTGGFVTSSSSSSSTGGIGPLNAHVLMNATTNIIQSMQELTSASVNQKVLASGLATAAAISASTYNTWHTAQQPTPVSFNHVASYYRPFIATSINSYGRASYDFSKTQFVGFEETWRRLTTPQPASSASSAPVSDSDNSDSSFAVLSSSMLIWSGVSIACFLLRSCFFLYKHRVKAVRTRPWLVDEKHLPRAVRLAAIEAAATVGNSQVLSDSPSSVTSSSQHEKVGVLEEYIVSELNPDQLSAVANEMGRKHRACLCPLWIAIYLNVFACFVTLILIAALTFYGLLQACLSTCDSNGDLQVYSTCVGFCSDTGLISVMLVFGFVLAPVPFLLMMLPTVKMYGFLLFFINEYFYGYKSERDYPAKWFSNLCWIAYRRGQMAKMIRKARDAKIKALKARYGKDWEKYMDPDDLEGPAASPHAIYGVHAAANPHL